MVNEQLVYYFHEWMPQGYTVDALKSELIRQGYPKNEVEEAAAVATGKDSAPPVGAPPKPQPNKYGYDNHPVNNGQTNTSSVPQSGNIMESHEKSAPFPKGGIDQIKKGTNDFYILGAKAGAVSGAIQGIVGAIIGTVISTLVFSMFVPASGTIFGLMGLDISGGLMALAIVFSLISGVIGGAIGGAIIGAIICVLWDPLPGQTAFMKSFILSIIIALVVGVLPSTFLGGEAIALIMLPLTTGVIGAAVFAYFFDRFIKKPLF